MTDLTVDREKFRRITLLLMVAVISIVFLVMIRGYHPTVLAIAPSQFR